MTQLTQERIIFVEQLHAMFFIKKGYGAFAFITIGDAMLLFDQYLDSNQSADKIIKNYVNSI